MKCGATSAGRPIVADARAIGGSVSRLASIVAGTLLLGARTWLSRNILAAEAQHDQGASSACTTVAILLFRTT
jgi:hypothetical protein